MFEAKKRPAHFILFTLLVHSNLHIHISLQAGHLTLYIEISTRKTDASEYNVTLPTTMHCIAYHTMYNRSTVDIAWLPRPLALTFYQPLQHIQPNQMQTSLKQ